MTESGRYRALPVKLASSTADAIDTLFGAVAIPGARVTEAREYSGGELAVALEPSTDSWTLSDLPVARMELWFYGARRVNFESDGDFLTTPQSLQSVTFTGDESFEGEVVFTGGMVTLKATHAVLRVRVI